MLFRSIAVPRAVCSVIDRAIQLHGGAGVTDATVLSMLYGWHRAMRIFDGPDEAHLTTLARAELSRATLRANPFPKVTDLICRLPLSTLFYQLEAVHLGDLLRL